SDIFHLMRDNRALLNMALDRKYRNIEWVHLDNEIVKYLELERLQSSMTVSKRLGQFSSSTEIIERLSWPTSEFEFNWDDLTINGATRRLLSSTGLTRELILRFEYDTGDDSSSKDDIRNYNASALMTSIVPFINPLWANTSTLVTKTTSLGMWAPVNTTS
ncbi:hypothetical protein H0H92_005516, partial [Tricholoma furcatifolium]